MYKFISKSEDDTINFASDFAKDLKIGDIIILSGELGSGKTKFTQGILKHFGLENEISSPTFTIVNEYNSKDINISRPRSNRRKPIFPACRLFQ